MKNIILCDIDGTVANNDHRQDLLKNYKDWDKFFSELVNDVPIYEIISLVNQEYENGLEVIFITGRPERYRKITHDWLSQYFKFELNIMMRSDSDKRNKLLIKSEMLENFDKKKQVLRVYENDPDLIKLWEEFSFDIVNACLLN